MITSKSIFLFRHTTLLDFPHWDLLIPWRRSDTPIMLQYEKTLKGRDLLWPDDVSWIILLLWWLIWKFLYWGIPYSSISDRFCEMTIYTRHILSRDYLILRAYPFWEDVFILGHSHLADFLHWDLSFCLWLLFSMDHSVIDTLGSIFSAYLVWFKYKYLCYTLDILPLTLLRLHWSFQSLIDIEPTYLTIEHDLIPLSWSGEDVDRSWVF